MCIPTIGVNCGREMNIFRRVNTKKEWKAMVEHTPDEEPREPSETEEPPKEPGPDEASPFEEESPKTAA